MVVFVVFILMFVVVAVFGYAFLKSYTPLADRPTPILKSTQVSGGACGNCGYPARGITTFECPECGADLREAGIVRPGQGGGGAGLIIVTALLYTVAFMIASVVLFGLLQSFLPTYGRGTAHLRLQPASGLYNIDLEVASREVIYNNQSSSSGIDLNGSASGYPATASTTLALSVNNLGPNTKLTAMSMEINPSNPPAGAWTRPRLTVNPGDLGAVWTDLGGNQHNTQGPLTDQDVLAFMGDAGLDITNQQNIDNAREFFDVFDGITRGQNQFTLTGFDSRGGGSGSSWSVGPEWVGPVYFLACIVLWVLGLTWIARRMSGNAKTRTKT